jgi:hypothetical protein
VAVLVGEAGATPVVDWVPAWDCNASLSDLLDVPTAARRGLFTEQSPAGRAALPVRVTYNAETREANVGVPAGVPVVVLAANVMNGSELLDALGPSPNLAEGGDAQSAAPPARHNAIVLRATGVFRPSFMACQVGVRVVRAFALSSPPPPHTHTPPTPARTHAHTHTGRDACPPPLGRDGAGVLCAAAGFLSPPPSGGGRRCCGGLVR